jgi:positive regulator of sigma E activity
MTVRPFVPGMNDGALLSSVIGAYATPLLLLVGAVIAASLAPDPGWGDLYAAVGAAAGFTAGLVELRALADRGRADRRFRPEIIRRA